MNTVEHVCRVKAVRVLTATNSATNSGTNCGISFEVELQSAAVLAYQAGQYLALESEIEGDKQTLLYTIANAFDPQRPHRLQLFIQNSSEFSAKVIKRLSDLCASQENVKVTLAMGKAYLQTDLDLPHLLIAAGSGISKIKCLTEEILKQRADADISIYWSNKAVNDFYLYDEFQTWLSQNNNLKFTPVLESACKEWSGRTGYLYQVIEEDFSQLEGALERQLEKTQTYLCGSPNMVHGTLAGLKPLGLQREHCYSDVFEF